MTSAYERATELANAVRTDSGGGRGVSQGKPHGGSIECHLFSAGNDVYVETARGFLAGMRTRIASIKMAFLD